MSSAGKKRVGLKKRAWGGKGGAKDVAMTVRKMQRLGRRSHLTQLVTGSGPERKWIDINYNSYPVSNAAAQVVLLNGNIPGATAVTHVGRKLVMKSLQLKGELSVSASMTGSSYIRIVLVYDKQADGAAPTWANVYQSTNTAGTTDATVYAMRNPDYRDRFVVISDRSFTLGWLQTTATQAFAGSPMSYVIDYYTKLNMETVFNAGIAGTIADIATGSLFLMAYGDEATAVTLNFSSRVRFDDQ